MAVREGRTAKEEEPLHTEADGRGKGKAGQVYRAWKGAIG